MNHWSNTSRHGFTIVEMLISVSIMGMLFVGVAALLQTSLQMQTEPDNVTVLYKDGLRAMERMTSKLSGCTFLMVPIAKAPTRNLLAFSGSINDDDDYYFGDPLFPRIDEDYPEDMNNDGSGGIDGIDIDNDGSPFENIEDDDEVNGVNEDWLDGVDNDADGCIDEDGSADSNNDGSPGIDDFDDDGDGTDDEGSLYDDDEDGQIDEDPLNALVFYHDSINNTLLEKIQPGGVAKTICQNVKSFSVTYFRPTAAQGPLVAITLQLAANGEAITILETVYPENLEQRCGKWVD